MAALSQRKEPNMKLSAAKTQDNQPGIEAEMSPQPRDLMKDYLAAGKLKRKKALITGGDSGIGRATAIGFAKEGADVAIIYLEEDEDAQITSHYIEEEGRKCVLIRGDIGDPGFCAEAVEKTVKELGGLDILVNNAGEQHVQEKLEDITPAQIERTFSTNIFSMFYLTQAALKYLGEGSSVINTTSITAYKGHEELMDYASTKGAIVSFTRSLSQTLAKKGIRVNAVAPGPIWTPLIPSTFDKEEIAKFGKHTPLGRPGQPDEVAPCFIFLASKDASYMTGQVLHPNGGQVVNG
jgi:NAD(P)-dependent dehydrogenase (short-subunit alcohol dehydrogenase family)